MLGPITTHPLKINLRLEAAMREAFQIAPLIRRLCYLNPV